MKLNLRFILMLCLSLSLSITAIAQSPLKTATYTHADTLRGSNGPGRDWWDVTKYDLHVKFNIEDSTISGYNVIQFKVLKKGSLMQIDLQAPLIMDSAVLLSEEHQKDQFGNGTKTSRRYKKTFYDFEKDGSAYFITNDNNSTIQQLIIFYHGKPVIGKRPPWDGGLIWAKDKSNSPWVSIACQGLGASVWYPCKDVQSD